mmetsp:Transcript_18358/g.54693  ORF Transcript_18358/g.54693 Transcript_18358/m.54693 type:complete len:244 (-) Transcript_18358:210-941(-)
MKPPTTSSDGHESRRWREGTAALRDAEIAPSLHDHHHPERLVLRQIHHGLQQVLEPDRLTEEHQAIACRFLLLWYCFGLLRFRFIDFYCFGRGGTIIITFGVVLGPLGAGRRLVALLQPEPHLRKERVHLLHHLVPELLVVVYRFLHVRENTLRVRITGSPREPVQPLVDLFQVLGKNRMLLQGFSFPGRDLFEVLLLVVPEHAVCLKKSTHFFVDDFHGKIQQVDDDLRRGFFFFGVLGLFL